MVLYELMVVVRLRMKEGCVKRSYYGIEVYEFVDKVKVKLVVKFFIKV